MTNTVQQLRTRTQLGANRLGRLLGADPSTVKNWLRGEAPSATRQRQIDGLARLTDEQLGNLITWVTAPHHTPIGKD